MKPHAEKIPNPKELEKEISEFLTKKFGNTVKVATPIVLPQEDVFGPQETPPKQGRKINFNLKPEALVAYLDQYIVKQDDAKAILATKICTHFNRVKHSESSPDDPDEMVGRIKNNVLMIGPTGVGKTYMVKLIAKKIGVPFVKGDATKFSETGYVGGDVEDLVRDLVREADNDIELAQYGIIYIDEIDKIAASRNLIGADVSRTGVQRGLLKPLEETEVDLKVPHDPISMFQEIERFRKTGQRDKRTVNTKNILFIVSGAFGELAPIISKRLHKQEIGFGATIVNNQNQSDILQHMRSEDLIEFGFESEFVGRLPVRALFERLTETDLFDILQNPNNPIILSKKIDFAAYGIRIKFAQEALQILARRAYSENTGARGLVSAVEKALLVFEKRLPSTNIAKFPVTARVIENPKKSLQNLIDASAEELDAAFGQVTRNEMDYITAHIMENQRNLAAKYNLTLTPSRIHTIAAYYCNNTMDIDRVFNKIKSLNDDIKKIELYFFKNYDINIVLEDDAIDYIIETFVETGTHLDKFYQKLSSDFEYGLKLVREKTGRSRFFITREALQAPEAYIRDLIREQPAKAELEKIAPNTESLP